MIDDAAQGRLIDTSGVAVDAVYTVADMFCGAGGITQGFTSAGFEPVLSVEMEPNAAATHARNFPRAWLHDGPIENLSDERAVAVMAGRELQVMAGGIPCQGFSSAGRRDPDDPRNQLYREFIRLARVLQPWFVVLENVPGLLNLDEGSFGRAIADEFADAGYPNMSVRVLQAAEYGVPQVRRRVMFIGNRFGLTNPYPWPLLDRRHWIPVEAAIGDLIDHPRDSAMNHEWTNHGPEMEERLSRLLPGETLYGYSGSWRRLRSGFPAPTIKANNGAPHVHYLLPRTISAREMARLQGFPDSFIFCGDMSSVMLQVGNAVPPPLAHQVALALRPSLAAIAAGAAGRES